MTALVVALLLSQDAGSAYAVRAGDVVSMDGVCMPDAKAIEVGKRLASAEAVAAALQAQPVVSLPAVATAGGVVLSVLAGIFGAGFAAGEGQRR